MTPSTGVIDAMFTMPENDSEAVTPTAMPTSAVTIGRAAASSDPSVTISTIAAKIRPIASPTPNSSGTPWASSDPK